MKYLLSISIGPVQDFIAAARRTADLYAGSQMLQEICKEVAQALDKQGGKLIFPSNAAADGANKILAELEGDPQELARIAKRAAQDKLLALWGEAIDKLSPEQKRLIDTQRAQEQLEHFLEFYAAWVPLGNDYPESRKTVERLLAGRKALREFAPTQQSDDGVPKSPLDPTRATIIRLPEKQENGKKKIILQVPEIFVEDQKLRFNRTEFLDAISLLKRLRGAQELSGKIPQTKTLARMAVNIEATNAQNIQDDLDDKQEPVDPPYFAILLADGDKMGELIGKLDTIEKHREFSTKLSRFSNGVQAELERVVHGSKLPSSPHPYKLCVYSGGDDVLAFLPVYKAVACAKALAEKFEREVGRTLSIGIAIVHYREPLSISLEAAREAEKAAKNKSAPKEAQGNRLAVALHTRGGVPVTVVRGWADLTDPKLDWDKLIEAYRDKKVSRGLAYELRNLAREWLDDMGKGYLRKEAERILERKEGRELELPPFENKAELEEFAKQLIIARFLSGISSESEQKEMSNA